MTYWRALWVGCALAASAANASAADEHLWGHWPLKTDVQDHSGQGRHPRRVEDGPLTPDVLPQRGVVYDGVQHGLNVDLPAGGLGPRDFTVSLWVDTAAALKDDLGTLIESYEATPRTGFQLSLKNATGNTSSQGNWRQLEFGIDAGTEPTWRDEGRPGKALLAFALCVHDGALYAATCEPGDGDAGHVYRYAGPGRWQDLGTLDGANTVTALATFEGALYAGTGKYRVAGSSLPESPNTKFGGRIYRLASNVRWELVGELPDTEAVAALAVFDGKLYASSLYKPAGFFRMDEPGRWTRIPTPDDKRVQALRVHNGFLYASSYDGGRVYRFDGTAWADLGVLGENTQTYSFAGYNGGLWVGTWPSGRVYNWTKDQWVDRGRLGAELEVMAMAVYNGSMYAGTLPAAEVYRFQTGGDWTRLKQLDNTPDVKYRRVWTNATYQGRLFHSTLPSGKIWSMRAGACVTHDRELPVGWQHVAAQRAGDRLWLYVNGREVAASEPFAAKQFDLAAARVLTIGHGAAGFFNGRLRDVRLHARALTAAEIAKLAADRSGLAD
jgi:hypothetical protein